MAKTYEILSVDEDRGCMLVKYDSGSKQHETEIPIPSVVSDPPTDKEIDEWVLRFWPHSQMEAASVAVKLVEHGVVNRSVDITNKVPLPSV